MLTGGLHGRFFQDISLLKLLKADNTTVPVHFVASDIDIVALIDSNKYDRKSLIGMMPFQVTMKSGRAFTIHCFRIRKSDRWIIGLLGDGQGLKKVFVNFEAVGQIKKITDGGFGDTIQAGPESVGGALEPPPVKPLEAAKGAPAGKPEITRFDRGQVLAMQGERFQPMLEHIKKHEIVDYKILSVFLNIDPASLRRKIRLGDFLSQEGLITPEQLEAALAFQKNNRKLRLGEILLEQGYLSEFVLAVALAVQFRLPFTILSPEKVEKEASRLFSGEQAREQEALPFKLDNNQLVMAVADPGLLDVQELSFMLNKNVSLVVTRLQDVKETITQVYGEHDIINPMAAQQTHELSFEEDEGDDESVDTIVAKGKEAPIVSLVNQIIIEGVDRKASDIHIIPEKRFIRVGYRINGIIYEKTHLNKNVQNYLVARFKILAGMNIVERRLPQDGRIHGRAQDQTVDIRVSVLPAQHGETVVLRLRFPDKQLPDLVDLGFSKKHLALVRQGITRSKGMVLVTGPTGSGKSTTVISFLKAVRDQAEKLHIITAEDPVELEVPGLTQVPVNSAIGMTFPRILRNILRHDPDVIMIGEIRDQETAKIAVQASLTGHLVFSTLHTNDAVSTLTRLDDMGIESFLVTTAVNLVIAQRLMKTLCDCAEPYLPDSGDQELLAGFGMRLAVGESLRRPKGCSKCDLSGYRGRAMVYELLEMDSDLRAMNLKEASRSGALQAVLKKKGFVSLIEHGLSRVVAGEVYLPEIMRHWEG